MLSVGEFIEIFPAFSHGADDLVAEILASARQQSFPKDAMIYSEGDSCSSIAFVLSGEIRVYKTGPTGREITLYEISRGETCILNASCILSRMPYPANAVSIQGGKMLLIPAADFSRLLDKHEEARRFVFSLLASRLTSVMTLVEEIAFGRMDERIFDYLKEKAENGKLETTHQKIANDLGTSREVVSRLLKDFERKGLVLISRNFIELKKTYGDKSA